ncbi:MAG: double-strand break repair helicase AddA [Rhizobiales bacterium]|nr:double-strand break repair helicase AddA [Hyphomicrobiales bacterium]
MVGDRRRARRGSRRVTIPRTIPADVSARQIAASDPDVSAWVSANAGSGKTHVLAQRVIRLLLDGVDPARILCITFTKAAAATMANRVFDTLAEWATLDDTKLGTTIEVIGSGKADAARRARARRLFATALEAPGGLKVQTIHAFCTRLLHQFPFEANVAARFTVLDGTAESQLLDSLMLGVLLDGAAEPDGPVGKALAHAITYAADQTFKEVVREAIGERHAVREWLDTAGSVDAAVAQLSAVLGVGSEDTVEAVDAEILQGSLIAPSEWSAMAAALAQGSKADREQGERFAALVTATGGERLDGYLAIFCTADREPRQRLTTNAFQRDYPGLFQQLVDEQSRICALLDRRRAIVSRDRTAALITITDAVLRRYQAEKDRRGLLDYADLIDKTLALFESVTATWVLYKLDLGIDHILIDEAQDTSPQQWQIVDTLAAEFAAGAGARGLVKRTLFAVGDHKQSIFSFQGAAPLMFAEMRRNFGARFGTAGLDWREVKFDMSFRSGEAVLGAVDEVFKRPEAYAGFSADPVETVHSALPDAAPGEVEIWPLIVAEKGKEVEGWDAPFDEPSRRSPQVQLAGKIAATVRVWCSQGRRPGDVLILVRQRGPLFEAIIRALKTAGVAVAGADRLILTEHIAVMDLMVLADALLLPQDDLALATVLRSPLFAFSDEQLFALAWNRRGSLRAALRESAADDAAFAQAQAHLDRLADLAKRETPFAFFARLLGAEGGRKRFLARLGPEANDALDEFLNLALDYESRETPSLQGLLAWLRAAQAEVKRDMEITRDEVRVMTVHGAKGLEAPIVVLADTTTRPTGPRDPRLMAVPADDAVPGTPDLLVWAQRQADDVAAVAAARGRARQAAQDEYRRLLYVAMTRAAERLVVCGYEGLQTRPEGCWYNLVCDALWEVSQEEPADAGEGMVRRYRKGRAGAEIAAGDAAIAAPTAPFAASHAAQQEFDFVMEMPEWLRRDAPAVVSAGRIVPSAAPHPLSAPHGASGYAGQPAMPNAQALARGRLVHRLLQSLPDVPPDRRKAAAQRYLERNAGDLAAADREAMLAQVLAVLSAPHFAALFAPGSRGEVPIVGRIARMGLTPGTVNGQVDRLAITPEVVLIADYKTDRPLPRIAPPGYVTQLALYRAVLARLYPGRTVRAALLWTEGPELMELSAGDLDQALAAVTSP